MKSRKRHVFALLALVLAGLAALWFSAENRRIELRGSVVLRSFDGEHAPVAATVRVYGQRHLRGYLRSELRRNAAIAPEREAAVDKARNVFAAAATERERAARVLRVAENSNAADLEACRARHAAAEAAAEEAREQLDRNVARLEELTDPASLLEGAPNPRVSVMTDAEGRFHIETTAGGRPFLVVLAHGREGSHGTAAWVAPGEVSGPMEFSNEGIVGLAQLRELAGVHAD